MSMRNFLEMVGKVIDGSDVVLEIADARMPNLTRNRKLEAMVHASGKRMIIVMNKADLVPKNILKSYMGDIEKEYPCVAVSANKRRGVAALRRKIFEIGKRESKDFLTIGVIGYPNTGKSSVANALSGKKKTLTGPTPGQTRTSQWITIAPGVRMIDTPGILPLTREDSEIKHAIIGALDPSKVENPDDVAREIIGMFLRIDRKRLEEYYGISIKTDDPDEIIDDIGKARNLLKKGGTVDRYRTCVSMIRDWQRGKLLLRAVD